MITSPKLQVLLDFMKQKTFKGYLLYAVSGISFLIAWLSKEFFCWLWQQCLNCVGRSMTMEMRLFS